MVSALHVESGSDGERVASLADRAGGATILFTGGVDGRHPPTQCCCSRNALGGRKERVEENPPSQRQQ